VYDRNSGDHRSSPKRQFIPCLRTDYPTTQGSLGNSEVLLSFLKERKGMSFAFFRQAGRRHSKEAWSMARTRIALQSLYPWLHLTSTRHQPYRTRWRSDWTPIWIVLLLMSILAVFPLLFPTIDSLEQAEHAAQNGNSKQHPLVSRH